METLLAHRERVRRLRDQFERMRHLRQSIYAAREESWDLRTHWEASRDARINELHEHIDAMAEEIELIREAHFGAATGVDRMGHAVSAPEYVLGEAAPPPAPVADRGTPQQAPPAPKAPISGAGLGAILGDETDAAADDMASDGLDAILGEEPPPPLPDGDLSDLAQAGGDDPSADAGGASGRFNG